MTADVLGRTTRLIVRAGDQPRLSSPAICVRGVGWDAVASDISEAHPCSTTRRRKPPFFSRSPCANQTFVMGSATHSEKEASCAFWFFLWPLPACSLTASAADNSSARRYGTSETFECSERPSGRGAHGPRGRPQSDKKVNAGSAIGAAVVMGPLARLKAITAAPPRWRVG